MLRVVKGRVVEREKRTASLMVELYCARHHLRDKSLTSRAGLCKKCAELLTYAHARLDKCQYGDAKTSCRRCATHCYKVDMRNEIRTVMRYSGPRLIFHAPLAAIRHLWG